MTARNIAHKQYEDAPEINTAPLKVVVGVLLILASLLCVYMALAVPQPGTGMGAIQNVLRGIGGHLAPVLPLALAWVGVLCIRSANGMAISPIRTLADALLALCLFSAVHVFFADRIRGNIVIDEFTNFVVVSFRSGQGGGALGALLCWPLYRALGVAGGFMAICLIALILLAVTGRLGTLISWGIAKSARMREAREERLSALEAQRAQEGDDGGDPIPFIAHTQLNPETDRRRARDQKAPARKPRPARDPHSEAIHSGEGMAIPAKRRRRPAPPTDEEVASGISDDRPLPRTARPAQRRRPAPVKPKEPDFDGEIEAAAEVGRQKAKEKAAQAEERRNSRRKAAPQPVELPVPEVADADLSAATAAMDIPAEDIPKDAFAVRPTPKKRREEPAFEGQLTQEDMSAMGFEPVEAPAKAADPAAQAQARAEMDQLKIEPEAYEAPDEEAPAAPAKTVEPDMGIMGRAAGANKAGAAAEADEASYNYPPIALLAVGEVEDTAEHAQRDMEKAHLLEETLKSFGISSRLIGIAHGPAVTRFELQPAAGVKVKRIASLADDIAMNLAAMSVRIEAPIPGKAAVGVEIPNDKVEMVRLRDVLESKEALKHPSRIAVGLGKDNSGRYIVADIAKMPHVLIAGQTGSGKSVCINSIITSILFRANPNEVKLILIDPKVVELSIYNDIPHLVCPVVTDPKKASSALQWAVSEMTMRYRKFAERGVRDIKGYNKSLKDGEPLMPQMVIVIDELADLMMVAPGEVEDSICRLAQLARACGMHLVIATQRPSVNVITGIIKANIPTRIAFSVASQVDSRTMIDHAGAEKLLGNGDMLFVPNGVGKPMRVQGAWVSDEEVHAIVEYIKGSTDTCYDQDMIEQMDNAVRSDAEKEELVDEYDPRLPEAVDIVMDMQQASVSMLQRRMRVGYARAGRLIDEMARRGIISEADGSKPREVLITREQARAMFEKDDAAD